MLNTQLLQEIWILKNQHIADKIKLKKKKKWEKKWTWGPRRTAKFSFIDVFYIKTYHPWPDADIIMRISPKNYPFYKNPRKIIKSQKWGFLCAFNKPEYHRKLSTFGFLFLPIDRNKLCYGSRYNHHFTRCMPKVPIKISKYMNIQINKRYKLVEENQIYEELLTFFHHQISTNQARTTCGSYFFFFNKMFLAH